ncbi:sensor histidine kinase [Runella salmonicolor]|uniref:histidine kinase n=1 Tax=Runella salmonicolor TaxID=2950278 RepID=A0ABT1FXV5_9BACT|nr:HAMP domain-containing sensor histidine kinase [Runella salmonicolor]MCP1386546.1 HAMP domain-containing histidine kinase [Runella salmonicolor]
MKNLSWKNLCTTGVHPSLSPLDEQRILLCNVLNICCLVLQIILSLMDFFWGDGAITVILMVVFAIINLPLYLMLKAYHYRVGFVYIFAVTHFILIAVAVYNQNLGKIDDLQIVVVGLSAMGMVLFDRYLQAVAIVFNVAVYWVIVLVIKDISRGWTYGNYYSVIVNFTVCYFFICVCVYFNKSIFRQFQALLIKRNEQLSQQTVDLQEINQYKDQLFAVISHDLRAPLYHLQSTIRRLNEGDLTVEQSKQIINEIDFKTKDVGLLLSNLLNWANLQLSGYKSVVVEIPIREVVEEAILFQKEEINAKQMQVLNKVPTRTLGWGDENHLQLILRNLLSNAVKFSFPASKIIIEAEEKSDKTVISIQDTGIGIGAEELERVLTGASRSSILGTNGEKGNGMGLWISQEFVRKNGGELWATSLEGEGSTFYFTVPNRKV